MMTRPTALMERDLLACVERLVAACETSFAELSGLQARSTKRQQAQLDGIVACATLLMRTQVASMKTLRGLLSEEATYNALDARSNKSLTSEKAAEERLRQSQRRGCGKRRVRKLRSLRNKSSGRCAWTGKVKN